MTKGDITLLGRIFGAEIGGLLPFQSKNQRYKGLEAAGMCEYVTVNMSGVRVSGWELTHKGRIAYCQSCPEIAEF